MTKMYYDKDADIKLIKNKKVAIIGYGSQGHAQAQNLRDSGVKVTVAEIPGTANYKLAVKHGFKPVNADEAAKKNDVIQMLVPDQSPTFFQFNHVSEDISMHGLTIDLKIDF